MFRRVSPRINLFVKILDFMFLFLPLLGRRRFDMKTVTASLFVLIMTATSSFAWGEGCASKNKANLQAMSCEAGWSWDEQAGECVETPTS
nr:hypothetical protein [uncultured bacterium]